MSVIWKLEFGDTLLVIGSPSQLDSLRRSAEFIMIEPNWSDQPVNRKDAITATVIVLAGIAASIAGAPVYLAMLASAVLALLLGKLSVEDAYRSVEWQAVFLIVGMYVVSDALVETHLADLLGNLMLPLVKPFGALGLAAGAYPPDFLIDSDHRRAGHRANYWTDHDQCCDPYRR